jgi:hypothetical protein
MEPLRTIGGFSKRPTFGHVLGVSESSQPRDDPTTSWDQPLCFGERLLGQSTAWGMGRAARLVAGGFCCGMDRKARMEEASCRTLFLRISKWPLVVRGAKRRCVSHVRKRKNVVRCLESSDASKGHCGVLLLLGNTND